MCYHIESGSFASKDVRIIIRQPTTPPLILYDHAWRYTNLLTYFTYLLKIGERWPPPPCGGGVADPLNTSPFPNCITTSNLVVLRQRVYVEIEGKLEALEPAPLRWGRGWPLEKRPHTCVILPNLVVKVQRYERYLGDPPEKNWPSASRPSRSLNVIGTYKDRSATYDFLLSFHNNHGPMSYRSERDGDFSRKSPILSTPGYLTPPLKVFPLKLGVDAWDQKKTRLMGYRMENEVWRYY